MPEQHYKPRSRHAPQFRLSDAARVGMLVKLKCTLCRRTAYFLATDLLEVYGDHAFYSFRLPCSRDGTAEFVHVSYYWPDPGDYGSLEIRRPGPIITRRAWRTVKLGEGMGIGTR